MAQQADSAHITIPSGISFASVDAVRRNRRAPKPTELAIAFESLKTSIGDLEQPYEPKFEADAADLGEWAGHLEQVLGAALTYARAVIDTLNDVSPAKIEDHTASLATVIEDDATKVAAEDIGFVADAIADVAGALRKAANRLREAA